MKFHNILEQILSSGTKITILKILFRFPEKKFSGRELARLSNNSASRTSEILNLFHSYGVVNRIVIGNTSEISLNRESILVSKLTPLFALEEEIFLELKFDLKNKISSETHILKAILFGSVSRKEETPNSDIDLFLLVKHEKDKERTAELIQEINISLLPKYGNLISELIYSKDEWRLKKNMKIVKKILAEGYTIFNRAHG